VSINIVFHCFVVGWLTSWWQSICIPCSGLESRTCCSHHHHHCVARGGFRHSIRWWEKTIVIRVHFTCAKCIPLYSIIHLNTQFYYYYWDLNIVTICQQHDCRINSVLFIFVFVNVLIIEVWWKYKKIFYKKLFFFFVHSF